MLKQILIRGVNSFAYAITITLLATGIVSFFTDYAPVLPEFAARFDSLYQAVFVQLFLIGISSASMGAGSIIMEMERLGLFVQSILYFLITAAVWISIGCYCWSIYKYPTALISVVMSYLATYIICWTIQYRICRKNLEEINHRIFELREEIQ